MPFLDALTGGLNDALAPALACFGPLRLLGIAETLQETTDSGSSLTVTRYPVITTDDGQAQLIDVNSDYALTIYHRVDSIINGFSPKQAFGESYGRQTESANMALLCFAFRDQVQKPGYWLENMIKDAMPAQSVVESLHISNYFPGASTFDKPGLLAREFAVDFNYPELIVFEMKYRIESTYRKGCFIKNNGC